MSTPMQDDWEDEHHYFTIPEKVRVDWSNIGEGNVGDYNPDDPEDTNYLCFYVEFWDPEAQDWIEPQDNSYCTATPADTPDEVLRQLAKLIGEDVQDDLESGRYSKKLEYWSWIEPSWLEKRPANNFYGGAYV